MVITNIFPSKHFIRSFKSLPRNIQLQFKEKEHLFLSNPFDQRLKTHSLKGVLNDCWAYSINYHYRVLFKFINNTDVLYLDVGTHEIY